MSDLPQFGGPARARQRTRGEAPNAEIPDRVLEARVRPHPEDFGAVAKQQICNVEVPTLNSYVQHGVFKVVFLLQRNAQETVH